MKKILIIFLLTMMYSCGARKVEKKKEEVRVNTESTVNSVNKTSLEEKKKEVTNTNTISTSKVDNKDETVVKETTYEPKDISKPAIITDEDGRKIVLENVKKTTKETTRKNNTKIEDSTNIKEDSSREVDTKGNSDTKVSEANSDNSISLSESKNSDRKAFNVFNLLWLLLIVAIIYFGYRYYKKQRNKLPI